jgi:hypothetical protein
VLKIIGKIVGKSPMKNGENERGKWNLINFFIEKTINKKKEKIVFTAMGRKADIVNNIAIGERLVVHFYPKSKENKGYYNTDLIVTEVDKHIKRTAIAVKLDGEVVNEEEFVLKQDNEMKFDEPKEEAPKITNCKKCGTMTNGVELCAFCEFGV